MTWWQPAQKLDAQQLEIVQKVVKEILESKSKKNIWVKGAAGSGKTLIIAHVVQRLYANNPDLKIAFLTYTHALKDMIKRTMVQGSVQIDVDTYKSYIYAKRKTGLDVIFLDEVQDISTNDLEELGSRCNQLVVAGDCEQRIYKDGNNEETLDSYIRPIKYRLHKLYRITESVVEFARRIMPWTSVSEENVANKRDFTITVHGFSSREKEVKWIYEEALSCAAPDYPSVILLPRHTSIFQFCSTLVQILGVAQKGPRVETEGINEEMKFLNYSQVNQHFEANNIPVRYLGNSIGQLKDSESRQLIYLMTYHSVKGLDFDSVFMPMLESSDKVWSSRGEYDQALFYVAITRARARLLIAFVGEQPHRLVKILPEYASKLVRHHVENDDEDDVGGYF